MLKVMIWFITVVGLLPVTLLALFTLTSTLSVTRFASERAEPGAVSVIGDRYVKFGSSKPLHLSTSVWPAFVVLLGVIGVVAGLWTFMPTQPKRFATGGFSRVEAFVETLLHSRQKYASLIISTPDGQHSVLLSRQDGQTEISISVDRTTNDGQEARTTEFFKQLGLSPTNEYLSRNGGIEDAVHCFEYELGNDAKSVARLCVSVFTDLFKVDDNDGLEFRVDIGS